VTEQTLSRARAGDEDAFRELTEPYRRELRLHVYRIVGSPQDAEDVLQETLLAAWRGLEQFQGRASVRSVPGCTGSPPTARWMRCVRAGAARKTCSG
jgi:DNA-directed RNA polymerase specialized sigma24 family protein